MGVAIANPDARALAAQVKVEALRLGFDACGVAAAGAADPENRLGDWLAAGYHADMDWILRTRRERQDVQLKLPGARSVVVLARNYYAPRPEPEGLIGRVSRYAWGRDYHRVLKKPVRSLQRYLDSLEAGATSYSSIDSGPVLERTWAQRAGVGWIGKNALVIRRELGSWFFLSVVLTTVELSPDPPAIDYCGSCRLCLDACPTEAIVSPRVVDSHKCISYQTIENRGEVPAVIQSKMGDWAFGCDICQDVCPWNRRAQITTEMDFHPREGHANLDISKTLAMNDEQFSKTFAGTPVARAKRAGLQRNLKFIGSEAAK